MLALLLGLLVVGATSAFADEPESSDPQALGLPTFEQIVGEIGSEDSAPQVTMPTNAAAAEGTPLRNLGRAEALELMEGVFGAELQAPAGILDDLEVKKFLSPNVAVVAGDGPPTAVAVQPPQATPQEGDEGEPEPPPSTEKQEIQNDWRAVQEEEAEVQAPDDGPRIGQVDGATLLDSSVPLATETPAGARDAVDLSLEHAEGELQPANPLVDVGIPHQLGEGIELSGPQVKIELVGAPEDRVPSTLTGSVAAYPNVAQDTDLVVAPTPTGVETLTQMRSSQSPRVQIFNLDLPEGATLAPTDEGGAQVQDGAETLVKVSAPTAIDSTGAEVPVALSVSGTSLTLSVTPDDSTAFPVLVDPLYQSYEWAAKNTTGGICSNSFTGVGNPCTQREEWGYETNGGMVNGEWHIGNHAYMEPSGPAGLWISTESAPTGKFGAQVYTVPRYFKETPRPTSFISHLTLSDMLWGAYSEHLSPYLFAGIWDPIKPGWVESYSHEGLYGHSVQDPNFVYSFANNAPDSNAKVAEVSIISTETQPRSGANVYVGAASVELGDTDVPQQPIAKGPKGWVNQGAAPITFEAADTGLGVFAVKASTTTGPDAAWYAVNGCKGVADAACPVKWKSTDTGKPTINVDPTKLPTGLDYLNVVTEDPVGNKSPASSAEVAVDHSAPAIALSGTMTEQTTLGTKRPTYTLKANVTDGTAASPQSGAAKASIEFNGTVVAKSESGCATENCVIPLEWQLDSNKYAPGVYTAKVTATDAVGIAATPKEIQVTINPAPPALALSGSLTEQATLGVTRPRYGLKVNVSAEEGLEAPPTTPTFESNFGGMSHPGDVAQDPKGNLWVADVNNNQIKKFTEKGELIKAVGSLGAGNSQFNGPRSLAIDAKGNVWVMDSANHRVEELNENGEFVKAFGSSGTGNGQLSAAEGIAIDPKGNIWVADTYNARLEEFSEAGAFIKAVGTRGSGTGQLIEPTGIEFGPGGNLWVADWSNNKVVEFNESGGYVRQFGSAGTGNGQFAHPDAIGVDSKGNVWVGDQNNERVQVFNPSGEFVTKFGSAGTGSGQFNFGYPMGIAIGSKGVVWVTDTGNNRIERWVIPGFAPSYAGSYGSATQFSHPSDLAVNSKGFVWAIDRGNNRLEKFAANGEWLGNYGTLGAGKGQLSSPTALGIDSKNNIWVTDSANNRVEEFSESGAFVAVIGKDVNKTKVEAAGTEAQRNLCTAVSGNVCQAGVAGSTNGQFNNPSGIALSAGGNLFVVDRGNGRVQKLSPEGAYLAKFGTPGTGLMQLKEPSGIAVAADGDIWVADSGNNRIQGWTATFDFIRPIGTAGSGNGQFNSPGAITIDPNGNLWVVDQGNGRVERMTTGGEYITQFGSQGAGAGQFSFTYPTGIRADSEGHLWVADTNNNRLQKWNQAANRSDISTEVAVDGKVVDTGSASCVAERCPLAREVTLTSLGYSVGKHTASVKAIDGYGNTTSKTLSFEVQNDVTKPALQVSGELFNAPEGWVEQESYGLNATATDSGYGLTSIAFKIDGSQVASVSQTCPDGACSETLGKQVSMALYQGGSHAAEMIATDGKGNTSTNRWTINVDPEGHISTRELEATIESAENTSPIDVFGAQPPEEIPLGIRNDIGIQEAGSGFESVGSEVPIIVSGDSSKGIDASIPEGSVFSPCVEPEYVASKSPEVEGHEASQAERLQIEHAVNKGTPSPAPCVVSGSEAFQPVNQESVGVDPTGPGGGTEVKKVAGGIAAAAPNTSLSGDTLTRPVYDGAIIFQAIRDTASPESYSWEVQVEPGQTIKALDSKNIEVYYKSGHPAFGIAAVPAHDAVGNEVPTTLTLASHNEVTLHVEHHTGQYVYPVLAGAGWRGGFVSSTIEGPKDEQELREEREREEREREQHRLEEMEEGAPEGTAELIGNTWHVHVAVIGPPVPAPPGGAIVSSGEHPAYRHFRFSDCRYQFNPAGPNHEIVIPEERRVGLIGNCVKEQGAQDELHAAMMVVGWFAWNQYGWVWVDQHPEDEMQCISWGPHPYKKVNCYARPWKTKGSLTVRGDYRGYLWSGSSECVTVYGHLNTEPPHKEREESITSEVGAGSVWEPCTWP